MVTAGVPTLLALPLEPVVVTLPAVTAGVVILVVEVLVLVVFTLFVATTAGVPTCLLVVVLPEEVVTRFEAAVTAGVVILDVVVPDTFTTTFLPVKLLMLWKSAVQ